MRTRIIGLGNTLLSDDGVGIYTVREVARRLADCGLESSAEICETDVAGFALMELMAGCDQVILVDAIQFDHVPPGTLLKLDPADLRTSLRLRSVHEIDLPTVLALGRHLGLQMPHQISIFGIQAADACTFGTTLSAPAQRGMLEAVNLVLKVVTGPLFTWFCNNPLRYPCQNQVNSGPVTTFPTLPRSDR